MIGPLKTLLSLNALIFLFACTIAQAEKFSGTIFIAMVPR